MAQSIVVRNGNFEGSFKKFKQTTTKSGILSEVKKRNEGYMKPGMKKREARKEAIRNSRKNNRDRD